MEELFGALIGLVRATEGKEYMIDEHTNRLLLEGLSLEEEASPEYIATLVEEVREEKHRIAPDCSTCAAPCGRTEDFDFSLLNIDPEDIRDLKIRLLDALRTLAKQLRTKGEGNAPQKDALVLPFLYKGLFFVGSSFGASQLESLLQEAEQLNRI